MKSINKALDILETLSANNELRLSEICEYTGITKSTANLILSALVKRGYASQKTKRGKYSLNNNYIVINNEDKIKKELRETAKPYLIDLSNKLKENVVLGILHNYYASILVAAETKNVLTTITEVGSITPLYCTGLGKIFLANFSRDELEQYFKEVELEKVTANTITDKNQLKASLKIIKEEGIAYDDEERILGVRNVAVGIRNSEGNIIAAIGITGPSVRLTHKRMSEILPDIKLYAAEISESLRLSLK